MEDGERQGEGRGVMGENSITKEKDVSRNGE
jgi:hypothetical protein